MRIFPIPNSHGRPGLGIWFYVGSAVGYGFSEVSFSGGLATCCTESKFSGEIWGLALHMMEEICLYRQSLCSVPLVLKHTYRIVTYISWANVLVLSN